MSGSLLKIRKIDFYPDEWLSGTVDLGIDECGVYIQLCALIYSRGGPVDRDRLRARCKCHGNTFNRALRSLIDFEKVVERGPDLDVIRCEFELDRARNRIRNASENAGKSIRNAPETDGKRVGNAPETDGKRVGNAPETDGKRGSLSNENNEIAIQVASASKQLSRAFFNYQLPTETLSYESDAREARRSHAEQNFEAWWSGYPHKVGKGAARKAFQRALTKTSLDQLHAGVERYKASKPAEREWCNPATWLNQERWIDQPAAKTNGAGGQPVLPLHETSRQPQAPPPERL